jgi:hypothetical protein
LFPSLQLPSDRPVYVISGGHPDNLATAVRVAQVFKDQGHYTNIIEAGMKSFPDAVRSLLFFFSFSQYCLALPWRQITNHSETIFVPCP